VAWPPPAAVVVRSVRWLDAASLCQGVTQPVGRAQRPGRCASSGRRALSASFLDGHDSGFSCPSTSRPRELDAIFFGGSAMTWSSIQPNRMAQWRCRASVLAGQFTATPVVRLRYVGAHAAADPRISSEKRRRRVRRPRARLAVAAAATRPGRRRTGWAPGSAATASIQLH